MITIKHIPNILEQAGRENKTLTYSRDLLLKDYLGQSGFDYENSRIIVSGKAVKDLNCQLDNDDEIIITPKIEGPIPAIIAAITAFFALPIVQAIGVVLAVASIGYSIYQAVTYKKPTTPSFNSIGDGLDESSAVYGWNGMQTTQDVGRSVPIVYGQHRVPGNVINAYISTDGDKSYLNVLLGLCEGEVESITDLKINNQPIANYDGCTYETKAGTNSDAVIPNFEELHSVNNVNVALNNYNDSHIYTTILSTVAALDVKIKFPLGLYYNNSSDGSINNWQVGLLIEYKLHTSGTWITYANPTIDVKSRTEIIRYYKITGLTPGQYDIRITRTTVAGDFYHIGDLTFASADEIRTDDLAYSNTAKAGIKALATNQLSGGMPEFSFLIKGKKILTPDIRDGSNNYVAYDNYYWDSATSQWKKFADSSVCTWDGVTYVTAYSANPIWCLKDLLTNKRYGLGEYISTSLITDSEWSTMAKYCDERVSDGAGGYEKRFRMDVAMDGSGRAPDILQQLASCFRGIIFVSGGNIKVVTDKAGDPVQLFGMGNIITSSLKQSWRSKKEVSNIVNVQFLDEDKDYQQEQISIIDEAAIAANDPVRPKDIKIFCTRMSQALREGQYQLNSCKYVTRSISFRVGIDALGCQVGDIISLSHDVPQWGFSGRAQANSTTTKVKLDQTVVIEAGKTYKIRVKFSDDTIEEKTVTDTAGSYTEVNVSSAFAQAPAAYDNYAFGENTKVKKDFRVMQLKRENNNEIEILAIEYNASLYNTDTIVLPTNNVSALSAILPNVSNLVLTERIVKMADGTIEDVIDVWFNKPVLAGYQVHRYAKAKIYISENAGTTYRFAGETSDTHFAIVGQISDGVTYRVAVVSISGDGYENKISNSPYANISVAGKSAPPSNVQSFDAEQLENRIIFTWLPIPDVDVKGYELRVGSSWDTGVIIDTIFVGTKYELATFPPGLTKYFIKAIDTSGNYSVTAASLSILVTRRPGVNLIAAYYGTDNVGRPDELWLNEKIQKEWRNLYNSAYNRICLTGKSTNRWDTWDMSWEEAEAGNYGYDFPVEVGEYPWVAAIWDFGAVLTDVMFQFNMYWLQDEKMSSIIDYRYSSNGITWTDWKLYTPGFITARYVQFRGTVTIKASDATAVYFEAVILVDIVDVEEFISNYNIPIAGANVPFTRNYLIVPTVIVTTISASAPLVPVIDQALITPTQFNCKLRNPETAAYEAGKINAYVKGF